MSRRFAGMATASWAGARGPGSPSGSRAHGGAPVSQPFQRFVRQSAGSCAGQYSGSGRSPAIAARIAGVAASPKRKVP